MQTRSKEPKGYSHPHTSPQKISMGNHKLKQCQYQVNTTSPIVLEMVVLETQKQHVEI